MKKKPKCRMSRGFTLFTAIVWTAMIPVNWSRLSDWRKVVSLGFAEPDRGYEGTLWFLFLASAVLAVIYWVMWARYDKKDPNKTRD